MEAARPSGQDPGRAAALGGASMSASVALPTGEVLPFHPSQAQYEHVARRLCRFGRVPGVKLRDLDFRVLCYLAGQQPGAFHHQYTLAEELDREPGEDGRASPDAVHRALNRLRGARLVQSDDAWEGTRSLPKRQYAVTRTCVYWLTHELCALLAAEERRRAELAAERAPLRVVPPPAAEPLDLSWAEPEIQKIAQAFDGLRLGKACGRIEVQTIRKRLREGCSLEALWLAIAGARARVSKPDGSVWAREPFAVVFASTAAVSKTAQEGLAIRAAAERFGAPALAQAAREPAQAAPASPEIASPMTAEMRSPSGSQEIKDRDPDLKTSTSEPERREGPTRRPLADHDARPEAGKSRDASAAPASSPRLRAVANPPGDERPERGREHAPCPPSSPPPTSAPHGAPAREKTRWTEGANPRPMLDPGQMRLDVAELFAPQGRHGEPKPRGWRRPS
jgi:hypothetical protein